MYRPTSELTGSGTQLRYTQVVAEKSAGSARVQRFVRAPQIVTRYWVFVNRNGQARRSRFQQTVEVPSRVCEANRRVALSVRTRSGSDGIIHSSWVFDRVATALRSDTAMRANDWVDRARRLHSTFVSINQVEKHAPRAPVKRFVRWRPSANSLLSVATHRPLAIPSEKCVINDRAEQTKECGAENSINKVKRLTRERQRNQQPDYNTTRIRREVFARTIDRAKADPVLFASLRNSAVIRKAIQRLSW